ncbi:tellurite resistance TerB family protein [Marivibrio halodurans]|uniref:Tellurite resistance TerB family protein n=1 Tax=Marivibrio halodurans TaxID=2039722 RepID=A0A8J7SNE0_9PROT|nr:TerB family tellurite resistance protein [Marivibrio halodurans]MBP5857616.1 tellurite resistance TerB family protein [Marivibrio halodurans]
MFDTLKKSIEEMLERHRQQPFLDACMASCALVAMADGKVSLSEQSRIDDVLEAIDRLSLFDVHEAIDLFNAYVDGIRENPVKGRKAALDTVERMADDAESGELLVRICLAVSQADGDYARSERDQIIGVCSRLGLLLEDFE